MHFSRGTLRVVDDGEKYNSMVGAVFIFNLIVGTGALTIPAAFGRAGWLLGVILISLLAFISYVTATFVVESMSSSNAILRWQLLQKSLPSNKEVVDDILNAETENSQEYCEASEEAQLLDNASACLHSLPPTESADLNVAITSANLYGINTQVEMGQMAGMYFNKAGLISFYLVICVYLYGDLAIYAAAISKTLRDITCLSTINDTDGNNSIIISRGSDICWSRTSITRLNAYRVFLACFALLLGPFVLFNIQKTKCLQVMTSLLRWLAFGIMMALASIHLASSQTRASPRTIHYAGLPNLFGVCVYSFMCHHSLPSLVTPIKNKTRLYSVMAWDYLLVLTFYVLLALTGVFSFQTLCDLYTLNFEPKSGGKQDITNNLYVQYFLSLFPVFTLGANFPIIAITLRNNLRELASSIGCQRVTEGPSTIYLYALAATIPPILVALFTENLQVLVGITGSFAGVGVQYIIPTGLLLLSRKMCKRTIGMTITNHHASPFRHNGWPIFILVWTALCLLFILINYTLVGL